MDQQPGDARPRCPVCGAVLQPAVTACPACGTPLAGLALVPPAPIAPAIAPLAPAVAPLAPAIAPVAESEPLSAAAISADNAADAVRCDWCGAMNPLGTEQCAHCGAMFPRPETDAALLRQAEERMRAETEALMTMRKRRQRKGLGRLFSN